MILTNKEKIIALGTFLAAAAIAVFIVFYAPKAFGATGSGDQASACTTYTSSPVVVGNQASTIVLQSHANRAFATIEQLSNATNTVSVSMASTSATTASPGYVLTVATSTSPVVSLTVGLATDKPYTGPVSVITNSGTTTVLVTDCLY